MIAQTGTRRFQRRGRRAAGNAEKIKTPTIEVPVFLCAPCVSAPPALKEVSNVLAPSIGGASHD